MTSKVQVVGPVTGWPPSGVTVRMPGQRPSMKAALGPEGPPGLPPHERLATVATVATMRPGDSWS